VLLIAAQSIGSKFTPSTGSNQIVVNARLKSLSLLKKNKHSELKYYFKNIDEIIINLLFHESDLNKCCPEVSQEGMVTPGQQTHRGWQRANFR